MNQWPPGDENSRTAFGSNLTRSDLMSRVRSSGNYTTELSLLRILSAHNISGWRRNYSLIGKPDFVFPSARVVVFVDGCFWHGHGCGRNLTPKNNAAHWAAKFRATATRDRRLRTSLRQRKWKVVTFWECSLRKDPLGCVRRLKRMLQSNTESSAR